MPTQHTIDNNSNTMANKAQTNSLRQQVLEALNRCFTTQNTNEPLGVRILFLEEVEAATYEATMNYTEGNQSLAAKILGVSRGTLRTKLIYYFETTHIGLSGTQPIRVQPVSEHALREQVRITLERYFKYHANQQQPLGVYGLILEEVESALYEAVMKFTHGNQSKAAKQLGVSRGTLRTKLKKYFDTTHVGTRGSASFEAEPMTREEERS